MVQRMVIGLRYGHGMVFGQGKLGMVAIKEGLSCYLSSSSVRCLENVGEIIAGSDVDLIGCWMSTPAFAYLDGTDTESEPFEDPIKTETPESPLTVAPPTSLLKSTSSTLVPILRRTACMAVLVPPAMSSGLFTSMAEKCYQGTSELAKDSEEDDDEEEDKEIEESLDFDSMSEDAEDEGPTAEDEDPAAGDEGLAAGVKSLGMDDESHGLDDETRGLDDEGHSVESDRPGLEEEDVIPGGQHHAAPVVGRAVSAPLGLGYGALRRRELALEEDHVYSTFKVGQGSRSALEFESTQSLTWIDLGGQPRGHSLPVSPALSIDPSPISSPMIPLTVPSPVASPVTAETEGFLTELGARVKMQGGLIRDHIVQLGKLSRALFERYDRDIGELFTRSVLALESWAGQTDAQRAALWHAISDTQTKNWELRLQIIEERRARLDLAKIVDSVRRRQEPRGDV
ncbi:hypothetical protein Tco_1400182 [Tanacetum coccineum]